MKTINECIRAVGAKIYTENLMSNPPQVRHSYEFSQKQLNEFVELIIINRPKETQFKLDFEK